MATIKEWENDLRDHPTELIEKVNHALNVLREWPLFRQEYSEIHSLCLITSNAKNDRIKEHKEILHRKQEMEVT